MINKIPSDEDPDPTMSPAPIQSTPLVRETSRSRIARDMFTTDETSPVRGLKSAQKTPAAKTPAKTVDFKSPTAPVYFHSSKADLDTPISFKASKDTRIRRSLTN